MKPATGKPDLALTIAAVETLGADALAHCRLEDGVKGRENEFVVRLPGFPCVAAGATLSPSFDKRAVHLFDRASGKRLPNV